VAALCHDLGHGPLSHVFEHTVMANFDDKAWAASLGLDSYDSAKPLKWHELVGQGILLWQDGPLHNLLESLEEGTSSRIALMLRGDHYLPYLPRLLSGDVDVDRCDYLLRDSHQSGVAYGRFDLDWLISTAAIGERPDRGLVVGFDYRKAPRVVEQFLVARRALYETVYQHKTVRSAEGMVGLLLKRLRTLGVQAHGLVGDDELFAPYAQTLAGAPLAPREVLSLDDYSLWTMIMRIAAATNGDVTATDLARRIVNRDLFKRVDVTPNRLTDFLGDPGREALYPFIERFVAGDPSSYVLVDRSEFLMLTDDEDREACLVDTDTADGIGEATAARAHTDLLTFYEGPEPEITTTLFVPPEAQKAVAEYVAGAA
jgi:uncharacterized protein